MNRFRYLRAPAVTLTVAWAGLLAAAPATGAPVPAAGSPASDAAASRSPPADAPDSWIYVLDEPGLHLDRAHDEFRRRQRSEAAGDVRKAAAMIDIEATHASGADRARLKRDADTLLQTAVAIESGTLEDAKRLDRVGAFARADLAVHHDMRAALAWLHHDRAAAGCSLAAAARYVTGTLVGLDEKIPAQLSDALQQVETLGDRLAGGTGTASESAWTQARDALGRALRIMGQKVESDRGAPV